ncbi:succinyl-CoA synthetase beta subunit [Rhodopseudomonas rhenobacensis]|uniref:Succinyl-CoA synthetase beta subunit n=1 Tax=Rhodopseudomonas rhenobacensis TaxID=87461 RepID=A0A7W8DY49_9BRAD|nr:ATP-grasp domain-containing protein [Rhodopseudomonas rhenobacensis]MBB5046909.1 succinyl-CoA synthetase beta subunit [Rhodopseudomonas rhenobacensis]
MNFEEHVGKALLLAPAGIAIPRGVVCTTPDAAADAARGIGPVVVKAQVPAGKRGKSGGIAIAVTPEQAASAARKILGSSIAGYVVERVLVEARAEIDREVYAAVVTDVESRSPLVLFSAEGGVEIEELAAAKPDTIRRAVVDVTRGFRSADSVDLLRGQGLGAAEAAIAEVLAKLYQLYRDHDAELVEINPLALLRDGRVVALDCKFVLDDAAALRQPALVAAAAPLKLTALEGRGAEHGLKFIQLDGNVGILANGAGLTMTTMDVIAQFGGRPANFLEIGGDAYTKAEVALDLVLSNPGVKSLVVNFCGAFARTDVMAAGVIRAWEVLRPSVPAFFSIHGTGADEAVKLVRERLGVEPYDLMEDAVLAAIEAAR